MRNVIKYIYRYLLYLLGFISQVVPIGSLFYTIEETPSLEKDSNQYLIDSLKESKFYLEYGSGGSTVLASKLGINYITIDTDLLFLNAVKQKVNQIGYKKLSKQTYLHRNIGPTSRWGHPLFPETRKQSLLSKFKNYSDPKFFMRDKPDLIMIDGRFRVATLLRMYDFLKSYSGWQVLFDDFFSRDDYKIVSKFFLIDERIGRLAVIKNVVSCNPDELNDAIKKYILNPY